jgi:bacteriocin resistance YdeI/OmpD-like protein/uncharacterized protein DUF1801
VGTRDKRVDGYIAKSRDFAKPILTHVREAVHEACPDVVETIKWGMPAFDYKGPLCGMAAFKQHATFGFWKSSLVFAKGDKYAHDPNGMAAFGKMTSLSDLPPKKVLLGYISKAASLNDEGVKVQRAKPGSRKPIPTPAALAAALRKNKNAKAVYDAFPPSHKRDYNEWIGEAKTEQTRARRVAQAVEWIATGKPRNWKYMAK